MIFANVKDFKGGWMFGDFEPSIVRTTAFEVAHHYYKCGFQSTAHVHKVATEYNYIVRGRVFVDDRELSDGDMFAYEPNEVSDVYFIEDTDLIIVKVPSLPTDKYEV